MDFAVENDVGLTPDNPHIIFAESSKGSYLLIDLEYFLNLSFYTILQVFFTSWKTFLVIISIPENGKYLKKSSAIASCICDPEMPFVNYHFITENNGEPMACECGYFFKLERVPVAPPMHKLMEIPDGGHFDTDLHFVNF